MTAREHRDAAWAHDRQGMRAPYVRGSYFHGGAGHWSHSWYPWSFNWNPGDEHFDEADPHLAAAATLEARYRDACALVAADAEAVSPFQRFATAVVARTDGVIVELARDAGPPDLLLAELRCHRAWLMLEPRPGRDDDLSSLDDVDYMVHAEGEGIAVMLTAKDAQVISELQRRAALAVERTARERAR